MQPIRETIEAIDELEPSQDQGDLLERITGMAAAAQSIAPQCVGVSIASQEHGVTFTLVATSEEIAALDGVQYLTSGPCMQVVEEQQGIATTSADLFSEPAWLAFAQASAASGVRSTVTFPIVRSERVVGTVNLYGATDDAFTGRHAELAEVFGASAAGAVVNADLSFSTRAVAEQAPDRLREHTRVAVATGMVAAASGVDVTTAEERLRDAARRAGVPVPSLAEVIISLRHLGSD